MAHGGGWLGIAIEQLPRNLRRPRIECDDHLTAAGQVCFELDGNQQVEQRASDLLIAVLIARRGRHEIAEERALRSLAAHLAPGTLRIERV